VTDGWRSAYNITADKFKEKWKTLLSYRKDMGKDTTRFGNHLVSMFGYIDNNKEIIRKIVKDVLSPALVRPVDELESLLLFGSVDDCIRKIKDFLEAGVNSIHFWPVNNYIEQIDLFSKEIIYSFQ
jgi:alkanesulfonate monooxygenase SsuD/methylene tetrahydromethanopterin reductase-like flavin-dependent oxidoreductase (luciferase family)